MKENHLPRVLILITLVSGLILLAGCNQSKKEATSAPVKSDLELLLGSWSNDEGQEISVYTFEKDHYTCKFGENFAVKGSYSLNEGAMTMTSTHLYSEKNDEWVSKEEFEKRTGADLSTLDSLFDTQVYAFAVSDDSLIFTPHPDNFDMTSLSPEEIQNEYTLKYTRL